MVLTSDPNWKHPNHQELFTPMGPNVIEWLERMRDEVGSWRKVAAVCEMRMKTLRNIRSGKRKALTYRLIDRCCVATGVGSVHEFMWFTAEDLVRLGIWDPVVYRKIERKGHRYISKKYVYTPPND